MKNSERQIFVDEISAGACSRGIFSVLFKGENVDEPFPVYQPNKWYDYVHNFEYEDIKELNRQYPELIPLCDRQMNLTSWGERVKWGLWQLILNGYYNKNIAGESLTVNWVGDLHDKTSIEMNKKPRKQDVPFFL